MILLSIPLRRDRYFPIYVWCLVNISRVISCPIALQRRQRQSGILLPSGSSGESEKCLSKHTYYIVT